MDQELQVFLELDLREDNLANGLSQASQQIRDAYKADSVIVQQVIPHTEKRYTVIAMAYGAQEQPGE
ncbi:hypothetical protein [Salinithrix halophila]|uniref:Uncharacterized protein n=1 Tax=Salinithrix halophila TaxID=1485204 RepID=A0ABV8JNG0_9BACL